MRCSKRASKLSKSVTQWVDIPNDSENNPRQAGLLDQPHRYGRRTRQIAIKKKTRKGYSYSIIVTTDFETDILSIVSDYDARGGICQDSAGLSSTKRRKHSFFAQQMLMLLNQLAPPFGKGRLS